jgi:hypothetical protein
MQEVTSGVHLLISQLHSKSVLLVEAMLPLPPCSRVLYAGYLIV